MLISGLGRGGTERQLIRLAQGLHARGIAVEVWCYGGPSPVDHELTDLGIPVRCGQSGSQKQKLKQIRVWMAEFQPDVMHGFMKRASSLAVLASFGRGEGIKDKGEGRREKAESERRTSNVERRTSNENPAPPPSCPPISSDEEAPIQRRNRDYPLSSGEAAIIPYPAAKSRLSGAKRPAIIGSDLSTATYAPHKPSLWFALILFAFADKVVTQTELNRRNLHRLAPWIRNKTRVIRNGLDLSRFLPRTIDKKEKEEIERRTSNVELRMQNNDYNEEINVKEESQEDSERRTSNFERRTSNEAPPCPMPPAPYPAPAATPAPCPLPPAPCTAPAAPFRFAVVGSVYSVKNPVRLVQAVKILRDQGVLGFRVEWYGRMGLGKEAESGSPEYHEAIGLIREHALEDLFDFKGETSEVHKILPDCDALIHPSLQEGFPNAVVEAMACGLPLVVSRVSDLPLVVETAKNGFVVEERDPESIAEGMRKMMETGYEERNEMGVRSRKLAEEWFGMERFVNEYVKLYGEVCGMRENVEHRTSNVEG